MSEALQPATSSSSPRNETEAPTARWRQAFESTSSPQHSGRQNGGCGEPLGDVGGDSPPLQLDAMHDEPDSDDGGQGRGGGAPQQTPARRYGHRRRSRVSFAVPKSPPLSWLWFASDPATLLSEPADGVGTALQFDFTTRLRCVVLLGSLPFALALLCVAIYAAVSAASTTARRAGASDAVGPGTLFAVDRVVVSVTFFLLSTIVYPLAYGISAANYKAFIENGRRLSLSRLQAGLQRPGVLVSDGVWGYVLASSLVAAVSIAAVIPTAPAGIWLFAIGVLGVLGGGGSASAAEAGSRQQDEDEDDDDDAVYERRGAAAAQGRGFLCPQVVAWPVLSALGYLYAAARQTWPRLLAVDLSAATLCRSGSNETVAPTAACQNALLDHVATTTALLEGVGLVVCVETLLFAVFVSYQFYHMSSVAFQRGGGLSAIRDAMSSAAESQRSNTRDNSAAPRDESNPIAMLFTDVQSSTALWAAIPEIMGRALETHNAVIRKSIKKHRGYEVKTIGDSFMVAFQTAEDAIAMAVDVQSQLRDPVHWDADDIFAIEAVYLEAQERTRREDPSLAPPLAPPVDSDLEQQYGDEPAADPLWCGLRVRIGVHWGSASIKFDDVTKGYDYFGSLVNTAARVEDVGNGGQVCVTETALRRLCDVMEASVVTASGRTRKLSASSTSYPPTVSGTPFPPRRLPPPYDADVAPLGQHVLRGLPDPVTLFQLLPVPLRHRLFAPLRLHHDGSTKVAALDAHNAAFEMEEPSTDNDDVFSMGGDGGGTKLFQKTRGGQNRGGPLRRKSSGGTSAAPSVSDREQTVGGSSTHSATLDAIGASPSALMLTTILSAFAEGPRAKVLKALCREWRLDWVPARKQRRMLKLRQLQALSASGNSNNAAAAISSADDALDADEFEEEKRRIEAAECQRNLLLLGVKIDYGTEATPRGRGCIGVAGRRRRRWGWQWRPRALQLHAVSAGRIRWRHDTDGGGDPAVPQQQDHQWRPRGPIW